MAKSLKVNSEFELEYQGEELDSNLVKELALLEKRSASGDFKTIIAQIDSEYSLSSKYMKPRFDEWKARLRLYNNQRRDPEAVGDPLLFTIHQTVIASLYNDLLSASFEPNERGDIDTAETLTNLAKYDSGKMMKEILDYEWDWDAGFFGRGLLLFREFDRVMKLPVAEVLNPLVCLRDPRASRVSGDFRGRNGSRFFGREMLLTRDEMKQSRVFFGLNDLGKGVTDPNDIIMDARAVRAEAQGYGDVEKIKSLTGENVEYRLLEWYTVWRGKRVLVTLSDNRKKVVRYTELKPLKGQRIANIPVIDRPIYPMSHDWDGVSIPDLVEDKQRGRATLLNLGLRSAKAGLHPMYLYDSNKIRNRSDLDFGFNKHIPVDGDPSGAIQPVNRKQIGQEVDYIFKVLDVAAQRATSTPEQQQGIVSSQNRTLGEINRVAANVGTRYSLSAKIFGWSESAYWRQWYMLYKKHFKTEIDEKVIRISGSLGVRFRTLTKENIETLADPDITIVSKVVADNERMMKLQAYQNWAGLVLSDPTANKRFAMRQLGRLSGLTRDDIFHILPPTVHELKAEDENEMLNRNELVEVDVTDDDPVHMEEHNKATENAAKYAHIQAHKKAMMYKLMHPEYAQQGSQSPEAQPQEELMAPVAGRGAVQNPQQGASAAAATPQQSEEAVNAQP